MMILRDVPDPPICRSPDLRGPCEFAAHCPESRQRLNHYADLRGTACWAYLQLSEPAFREKREAALERAAIRAEGAA